MWCFLFGAFIKKNLKIIHKYNKINFYKWKKNKLREPFFGEHSDQLSSCDENSLTLILYFKYIWTYETYNTMH